MKKTIQDIAEKYLETSSSRDFTHLYNRVQPGLHHQCKKIIVDEVDTEEIVSLTFEKMIKNIHQYDSSKSQFSTWLYGIARNECLLFLKRGRKHQSIELTSNEGETFLMLSDDLMTEPEWEFDKPIQNFSSIYNDVVEKMNLIPEKYKGILIDREINKMSYEKLAIKYNMPKKSMATRIRRARLHVRDMFPELEINISNWK